MFALTTRPRSRWSVFDELESLHNGMSRTFGARRYRNGASLPAVSRLIDDLFADLPAVLGEGAQGEVAFIPRMDVSETDTEVTVSAELPGLEEKEITVEVEDSSLSIRGERKVEDEQEGKSWFRREQTYGAFHRCVELPDNVDTDKAKATFKNGILSITVPKTKEVEPKRKQLAIEKD
jgi:HSP20 family protein